MLYWMQIFMKFLLKFNEILTGKLPVFKVRGYRPRFQQCLTGSSPWTGSSLQRHPRPRLITLSEARSRLNRSRFSRPNTHFAAFFEIYRKIIFSQANFATFFLQNVVLKKSQILTSFSKVCKVCKVSQKFQMSAKI